MPQEIDMARKMKPAEKRRMREQRDTAKRDAEQAEALVAKYGSASFLGRRASEEAKKLRETQRICEMYVGA